LTPIYGNIRISHKLLYRGGVKRRLRAQRRGSGANRE
jgi:hypothetical protein